MKVFKIYVAVSYIRQVVHNEPIFDKMTILKPFATCVYLKKMFSTDEKKWIVLEFARTSSPAAVRRKFLLHFKIKGWHALKYKPYMFTRVRDHFADSGSVHSRKGQKKTKTKRTETAIEEVKNFLHENPSSSLKNASERISPSKTTMWRIVRFDLKMRFYRFTSVQTLTDEHKAQRRRFCEWLLEQPSDLVERIVWTDEKFFVLHQKPHRKNDGTWSEEHPHQICETKDRNDAKVMIFVALINGMAPLFHAFIDEDGQLISVNGDCYLNLLQNKVWPRLRHTATRSSLWWMQDGAPPHCTNAAITFLNKKFQGRVISRRTANPWPAHSPDLNPLDFHFWAAAQNHVFKVKPASIDSLVECVKSFTEGYSQETIIKTSKNVLKRARLCLESGGGHFQQFL